MPPCASCTFCHLGLSVLAGRPCQHQVALQDGRITWAGDLSCWDPCTLTAAADTPLPRPVAGWSPDHSVACTAVQQWLQQEMGSAGLQAGCSGDLHRNLPGPSCRRPVCPPSGRLSGHCGLPAWGLPLLLVCWCWPASPRATSFVHGCHVRCHVVQWVRAAPN